MAEQGDRQEHLTSSKEIISSRASGEIVKRIAEQAEERGYSGLV